MHIGWPEHSDRYKSAKYIARYASSWSSTSSFKLSYEFLSEEWGSIILL